MIEAHTFDAWTRLSDRASVAFSRAMVLGGFAAPLFLWLAGISAVLLAARTEDRSRDRAAAIEAVCRRGAVIFILAFLFRLQAFVISPGSHPIALFRVDILNIMGPAVAIVGVIWGLGRSSYVLVSVYAACALATTMLTPIVRTSTSIDLLPTWVQWYLRPAGEHTTFTAFPWIGFVFAGAACGLIVVSSSSRSTERWTSAWLAVAGLALVVLGLYTASRPSLYRESSFWTSSPTYFAVRVGVILMALSLLYFVGAMLEHTRLGLRPLARLGRSSLFVYWIHVELVYGYATWPIHRRLPFWGVWLAGVMFAALMYGVVVARDRLSSCLARGPLPSLAWPG